MALISIILCITVFPPSPCNVYLLMKVEVHCMGDRTISVHKLNEQLMKNCVPCLSIFSRDDQSHQAEGVNVLQRVTLIPAH
jgi:hypothetical protein